MNDWCIASSKGFGCSYLKLDAACVFTFYKTNYVFTFYKTS